MGDGAPPALGARPWPGPSLPAGYRLRETRPDPAEDQGIADLLNAAFGRTSHTAAEFRGFTATAPPTGAIWTWWPRLPAACSPATWGSLGPGQSAGHLRAGLHPPEHRRRGLALAMVREGLRRLRALGAVDAYVESSSGEPPNALYDAAGFAEAYLGTTGGSPCPAERRPAS